MDGFRSCRRCIRTASIVSQQFSGQLALNRFASVAGLKAAETVFLSENQLARSSADAHPQPQTLMACQVLCNAK
jgi:hypothetical protein